MQTYLNLLTDVLKNGVDKPDRTGTGTRSVFGRQFRHDLSAGFPLLTTKKMFFKGIAVELLWFLRGDTHIHYLHEHDVHIWDDWSTDNGDVGPVYGHQWRFWASPAKATVVDGNVTFGTIDQLANVIEAIKTNPNSRRHIVTAWNPADIDEMALPPCHQLFQFNVTNGRLNCSMYQRSADIFLGMPFNIASYALLTHMVAQVSNLKVGELVISFGDLHLYRNHFEQALKQLKREPKPILPELVLDNRIKDIDEFELEHIGYNGYHHHPKIEAPISV